jgi:lipopolysaccharide/colanic/teichoic acid biosynthesis glycosyltransferase
VKFAAEMPRFNERMRVRPGMTGLAQVRGWRGDTNLYARLASDLEYLSHRGFRSWLWILARTIWIEVSGEGHGTVVTYSRPAIRSQSDFPNP